MTIGYIKKLNKSTQTFLNVFFLQFKRLVRLDFHFPIDLSVVLGYHVVGRFSPNLRKSESTPNRPQSSQHWKTKYSIVLFL